MDVKAWLSHKLDEPWSAYRLVALLSNDIFEAIGRKLDEFEATALCRILLSIVHLRPAQVRDLHGDIEALLQSCSSQLWSAASSSPSSGTDFEWVGLVAHSLRSFTKEGCVDFEIQHLPEVHEQAKSLINVVDEITKSSSGTPLFMLPDEAQFLDASLCPPSPDLSHAHFQVTKPFLFEATPAPKEPLSSTVSSATDDIPKEKAVVSSASAAAPGTPPSSAASSQSTVPSRSSPVKIIAPAASSAEIDRPGFLPKRPVVPFKRKTAIKVMGLNDAAELQDRIRKRTRPTEAEMQARRKEKEEVRQREKMEREAKRSEEREAKKRKKEEDKEARRSEKEAARELRMKIAADKDRERSRHKEEERLDRLSRQAAEVVLRENTAQMELLQRAHAQAQAHAQLPAQAVALAAQQQLHQQQMQQQQQQMQQQQQQLPQQPLLPQMPQHSGHHQIGGPIRPSAFGRGPVIAAADSGHGGQSRQGPIVVATALPVGASQAGMQHPLPGVHGATAGRPMSQFAPVVSPANAIRQAATAIHAAAGSGALQQPAAPVPVSNPLFQGANKLSPVNRVLIEKFLSGQPVSHPDAKEGIMQVTMSENLNVDHSGQEFLEIIVFEMNFNKGSWRKLKRRKRTATSRPQ